MAVDQSHTSTSQEVVSAITYSQTGAGSPPPPAVREQEMHTRAPRTSTSSSPHMLPRLGVPRGDRYAVSHSQTHRVAYSHCQTDNAIQKKRKLLPRATPGWWSQIRLNLEASKVVKAAKVVHHGIVLHLLHEAASGRSEESQHADVLVNGHHLVTSTRAC